MQELPAEIVMQAPSICFICETSPDRSVGVRVIDTARTFVPGPVTHLNGRKYVCEGCVKEFGRILGFVPEDDVRASRVALNHARRMVAEFQEAIVGMARGIEKEVSNFGDLPAIESPTTELESTLRAEAQRSVEKENE